mgnify:CR=1 FL=1
MVNRINDNDYYGYSKLKMPNAADKTENGEKFSLNYRQAQEKTEEKDKKEKSESDVDIKLSGKRSVMQSGVRLELSGNGQPDAQTAHKNSAHIQGTKTSLLDTLRSLFTVFTSAVKDFLYKLWNDSPSQEPEVQEAVYGPESDAAEKLTEEYLALHPSVQPLAHAEHEEEKNGHPTIHDRDKEQEIRKYLHTGNLEQVLDLLTDHGRKTMAKNSTLLTYYDRTGKLAQPSASDQERILHGDRNVRKL